MLPSSLTIVASAIAAKVAWNLGGGLLRRYFVRKYTVIDDLPYIAEPRPENQKVKGTAVVCGGR